MISVLRLPNVVLLSFFVTCLATAQGSDQPNAAISHVETYLQQMQVDMDAIEKEQNPELRHSLMRKHMEGMAKAMAILQNEMLPYLQSRVGPHADGSRRTDIGVGSDDSAAQEGDGGIGDLNTAIELMDETLVLRQMEAILEQMSKHRKALQEAPE